MVLEVEAVSHAFGSFSALEDVSIQARAGEFLTLLGPSGSGKTTLLRIIAGLEEPSAIGALRIAGEEVADLPPNERNVTTVFQHFALFPHMTVGENVEYGLRLRRVPPAERRAKALEALALARLPDKYARRIHQLSGGERQRVALARALVLRPALLLLDEPLGALDEKLRMEMQFELLQLQRAVGTAFVYVTHSQEEALTMSDRIVLLSAGHVVQEGAPQTLYERPLSRFVADFMGVENLFDGTVEDFGEGMAQVRVGEILLRGVWTAQWPPSRGMPAFAAIRGQSVRLTTAADDLAPDTTTVACEALHTVYKGKYVDLVLKTQIGHISARLGEHPFDRNPPAKAWWPDRDCVVGLVA